MPARVVPEGVVPEGVVPERVLEREPGRRWVGPELALLGPALTGDGLARAQ
ncbi:MAG: hypothetical protein LBO20_02930 [Bifidobacteriaceae bacterium]|nr:hypothetical protein [Bifidobacteriaceae bacterium]